jgi:DNA-binding GntR family transcriptional regulator
MAINQKSMGDEAYEIIRAKIVRGEIHFGEKLHIDNLAKELGISHTPIREALNRLMADGMAQYQYHKGVFVVDLTEQDIDELSEARVCLEEHLAEAVVHNATPAEIQIMFDASRPEHYSGRVGVRTESMHDHYVDTSGNRAIKRLHRQVNALLSFLIQIAMRSPNVAHEAQEYWSQHLREEQEICRAIEARDVPAVKEAIRLHVANYREFLLKAKVASGGAKSD